jgi:hypothetical protein
MRIVIGIVVGVGLTVALLYLVLGGINVWRKVAWPNGGGGGSGQAASSDDGHVHVRFYRPPDAGAHAGGGGR